MLLVRHDYHWVPVSPLLSLPVWLRCFVHRTDWSLILPAKTTCLVEYIRIDLFVRSEVRASCVSCTEVPSQIGQWGWLIADQVSIVLRLTLSYWLSLYIAEDCSRVITGKIIMCRARELRLCGCTCEHLVRELIELEPSSKLLSCVYHDLSFLFMLATGHVSSKFYLLFRGENISRTCSHSSS